MTAPISNGPATTRLHHYAGHYYVQGPYSWWSWRGQAFVNNAGWRIDYQYATPALGERARSFEIGRADEYAERFSDHAPVSVTYEI